MRHLASSFFFTFFLLSCTQSPPRKSYGGGGFVVDETSSLTPVIDLTSAEVPKVSPKKRKRQRRNQTRVGVDDQTSEAVRSHGPFDICWPQDTTVSTSCARTPSRPTPCGIIYCHKIATCETVARRLRCVRVPLAYITLYLYVPSLNCLCHILISTSRRRAVYCPRLYVLVYAYILFVLCLLA